MAVRREGRGKVSNPPSSLLVVESNSQGWKRQGSVYANLCVIKIKRSDEVSVAICTSDFQTVKRVNRARASIACRRRDGRSAGRCSTFGPKLVMMFSPMHGESVITPDIHALRT